MKPIRLDPTCPCRVLNPCTLHRLPTLLLALIILIGATFTSFAQTGPAGVGNSTTNKIWLKADAGFTQASNTPVASWLDQSGSGFHAQQATAAKRPIYREDVLNGKPVILFDRSGGNKHLDITTSGVASLVNNSNTIYVVGAAFNGGSDNSTNAYQAMVAIPGYHSGIMFRGYPATANVWVSNYLGSTFPGTPPTNTLSTISPITQVSWYVFNRNISEIPSGTTQQLFVNGDMINSLSGGMQLTNYSANLLRLGAANVSGTTYLWGLTGGIAEIIAFNISLNGAQRVLIDNYLSTKYNLGITTDYFQNNDPQFVLDVQGIGTTDGTSANKHMVASNGKGLQLAELNNSLDASNEFLIAAHNSNSNELTTQDMPVGGNTRWRREWYIEKTGQLDAKLGFDISRAGLSTEIDLANRLGNFRLIYKTTAGGTFAVMEDESGPLVPTLENDDQITFSLTDSQLSSGYYTIMIMEAVDPSPVKKQFNGLITSAQWRTDQPYMVTEPGLEGMYMYSYDDKYQIKDARWAENVNHALGTFDRSANKFRLTDMSYDPNGNILTLKRFDKDQLRQHNLNYTYKPNTNQLQSVSGYTNAYTYNAVGQMIGEDKVEADKDQYVDYDVTGKVRFVYSDALKKNKKVEYLYDDRGFRLAKVNYLTQRTTWYIRDASGNVVSINEQVGTPTGLFENLVWGSLNNVVVDANGRLTVASGTGGTAVSANQLKPNQNGYIEYVIEDLAVPKEILFHVVGQSSAHMYRFQFYAEFNIIAIRKGGLFQSSMGYVLGDVIRMERVGANMNFYQNNVLKLTLSNDVAASLEVMVMLNAANAKVSNLKFKYTSDPTGEKFPINNTEIPIYGSGKLGTCYPLQDSSMNYEITDHLGNVRALLRDNISVYTATMEDNGQAGAANPRHEENEFFQNIPETVVGDVHMNHTPSSARVPVPNKAAYLFWNDLPGTLKEEKSIGPAIALRVQPGDVINGEAWSRFERKTNYTHDFGLLTLSTVLGNNFVGVGGFDGYTLSNTISNLEVALPVIGFSGKEPNEEAPYAYLNYIVYDDNMNPLYGDRHQVPTEAGFLTNESSLPGPKLVEFEAPITIEQSGYIYVWVSNESIEAKVWFDDLKVSLMQNIVVQATDYGVWGDVIREQKTDESVYRFGYQGQYSEKDDETGWNHFELREYDPVIGRWLVTDPAKQYPSPYVAYGNNPINKTDPDGGCDTGDCPPPITYATGECMCSSYDENLNPVTFIPEIASLPVGFPIMEPLNDAWDFISTMSPVAMRRYNGQEVDWDGLIVSEGKVISAHVPEWLTPGGGGTGISIIKGLQKGLRNPALVKELANAMKNGTYEFNALRGIIGGYKDAKGVYYVAEGHHRMAAAFKVFKETGNAAPIKQLIQNGRWTNVTSAPAGARPLPSTEWWGAFRNWIGF